MAQKDDDTLMWLLLAGGVGVGLYFLLRPREAEAAPAPLIRDRVADVPVLRAETPTTWAGLLERLRDVDTLWKMGRISPGDALLQVGEVEGMAERLTSLIGSPDPQAGMEIRRLMNQIRESVGGVLETYESVGP